MAKFISLGYVSMRKESITCVKKTEEKKYFPENEKEYYIEISIIGCSAIQKFVYEDKELRDKIYKDIMDFIDDED